MLPSDMNSKIKTGTAGYNSKILISDGKFNLGENGKVNALKHTFTPIKSHTVVAKSPDSLQQKPTDTHEEEKAASILFLTIAFTIWYMFR